MNKIKKSHNQLFLFVFSRSPLDIDLFTGILTESHVAGSNVGPTLDCLIGDQFQKLKYGDRYWYQGEVNGYTSGEFFLSLIFWPWFKISNNLTF